MYRGQIQPRKKTTILVNESYVGETIEDKIKRITQNKEPIKDGAPLVYTERKDGVLPGYNIRTDRWDVAVDATDVISKQHQARREERGKVVEMGNKNETGGQSIQGEVNT